MFNFNMDFKFNFGGPSVKKAEDFSSFCDAVSYPPPFPAQLKMREFIFSDDGPINPRMVLGARGYGKTDYGTILGTAYELVKNPQLEVLIVTKESDRGKEIVAEIRSILEKMGVEFDSRSKRKLILKGKTGKEPNVIALTIRSRGFRGRHPHIIIMEDPITPDDSSPAERKRVKKVYEELYKLTANIVIIGQPVHKLDLYQELRFLIPTYLMKHGDIPELDTDLDAQRGAGVSEYSIQASYFLEILDDNSLPFNSIEVVDYWANKNVAFIDPSHMGKDFTAIAVGGIFLNKAVVCGFVFKKAWYNCLEEIEEIAKMLNISRVGVETNGLGDIPVLEMQKIHIPAVGIRTTENKDKKINNVATFVDDIKLTQIKSGSGHLLQANQNFVAQVKNWEYDVEHDDAPDALAMLIKFMGLM